MSLPVCSLNYRRVYTAFLLLLFSAPAAADLLPDYYEEPGISAHRDYYGQDVEYIDPFTGALKLQHGDAFIPGNGGMDIAVRRHYQSLNGRYGNKSLVGVGWDISFGNVSINDASAICSSVANGESTTDNPVLQKPDGSVVPLITPSEHFDAPESAFYVTPDRWIAECIPSGNQGLIVTSSDGRKWQFDYLEVGLDEATWHVSKITDVNGNYIDIQYRRIGPSASIVAIDSVTASGGGQLSFSYQDELNDEARLTSISSNMSTPSAEDDILWTYGYRQAEEGSNHYFLTDVTRPDGLKWTYDYNPSVFPAGAVSLKQITYPHGAVVDYTYKYVFFPTGTSDTYQSTAIEQKATSGPELQGGTWNWSYDQNTERDRTIVTGPIRRTVYDHWGVISTSGGTVWKVGLLQKKEIQDLNGSPLHTESYSWTPWNISDEDYYRTSRRRVNYADSAYGVPLLDSRTIDRSGDTFTLDNGDFDVYGYPQRVIETGNDGFRVRQLRYSHKIAAWIIGLVDQDVYEGTGLVSKVFNDLGQLEKETRYGIATDFTYHDSGDLHTVTDARLNVTTYEDYFRGVPRKTTHPVQKEDGTGSVEESVEIDARGLPSSTTDGRGNKTWYEFDGLGQLTKVTRELRDPVLIDRSSGKLTVTHGISAYKEVRTLDGFGRAVRIDQQDLETGVTVSHRYEYDVLGRLIFESQPGSIYQGTTYSFDELGRKETIQYADLTSTTIDYHPGHYLSERDQLGNKTDVYYRSYADPDEAWITKKVSPEGVTTEIERNVLGMIDSVAQGSYVRDYVYNENMLLKELSQPENGLTEYRYDGAGNLRHVFNGYCSGVGPLPVENGSVLEHDGLNRVVYVTNNHCDGTMGTEQPSDQYNIEYTYDDAGNLIKERKGESAYNTRVRTLRYDKNNDLESELFQYFGQSYLLEYRYDNLGHLERLVYPSGRVVDYAPDHLGRPTQATPFVSNVVYNVNSQPRSLTFANGLVQETLYDSMLRPDRVGVDGLLDLDYAYDNAGNVSALTDALFPSRSVERFVYDGLGRLRSVDGLWGNATYDYDLVGNLTNRTIGPDATTFNYNTTTNRLESLSGSISDTFTYTSSGKVQLRDNGVTYLYGYDGNLSTQLTPDGDTQYSYDARDLLARKDNATYLYDQSEKLIGKYEGAAWVEEYFYLFDKQIAKAERLPEPPPEKPASLAVPLQDDGFGDFTVSWAESVAGTTLWYQVQRQFVGSGAWETVKSTNELAYSGSDYSDGEYLFRVNACNYEGCSDWTYAGNSLSVLRYLTVPPSSPSLPEVDYDGIFQVSWTSVPGTVEVYELSRSTDSGFLDEQVVSNSASLTFGEADLAEGEFFYRLRACNSRGCSDYSPVARVMVNFPSQLPVIEPPADLVIDATSQLTSVDLGQAVAYDDVQSLVTVADNTGPFPIGETVVTWTASNKVGTSSASQTITLVDSKAPVFQDSVSDFTVEADGPLTQPRAHLFGERIAVDNIDGSITVAPDKTGPFPLGSHTVTWVAEDSSGNQTIEQIVITIEDTTPPQIDLAPNLRFESNEPVVVALTTPVVTDIVEVKSVTNDAPAEYPVGTTPVLWKATDTSGNSHWSYQYVTVVGDLPDLGWGMEQEIWQTTNRSVTSNVVSNETGDLSMIAWVEDQRVNDEQVKVLYRVSEYVAGRGWSKPTTITENIVVIDPSMYDQVQDSFFKFAPSISMNALGEAMVVMSINGSAEVAHYTPSGGWSNVEASGIYFSQQNKAAVQLFDNGDAVLIANQDSSQHNRYRAYSYSPTSGWTESAEQVVEEPGAPAWKGWGLGLDVAANGKGDVVALWGQDYNSPRPAANKFTAVSGWSNPKWVPEAVCGGAVEDFPDFSNFYMAGADVDINSFGTFAGIADDSVGSNYLARNFNVVMLFSDADGNAQSQVFKADKGEFSAFAIGGAGSRRNTGYSVFVDQNSVTHTVINGLLHVSSSMDLCDVTSAFSRNGTTGYPSDGTYWDFLFQRDAFLSGSPVFSDRESESGSYQSTGAVEMAENNQGMMLAVGRHYSYEAIQDSNVNLRFNVFVPGEGWKGDRLVSSSTDLSNTQLYAVGDVFYLQDGFTVRKFGSGDLTAPAFADLADIEVVATGEFTEVTFDPVFAQDNIDGTIQAMTESPGAFGIGEHVIVWRAIDSAGNEGHAFQKISVIEPSETDDTIPPAITVPEDITQEASGILTEVEIGQATASDYWDGDVEATASHQGPFPLGATMITWTAVDSSGNQGVATQTVTIVDTTPPNLTIPDDVQAATENGEATSVSLGTPVASDIFEPVTISNDSPGMFEVGSTPVTWTAIDANGNQTSAVQTVVVEFFSDPPTARAGADQSVQQGAQVSLDGSASSDPDGDIETFLWRQISGPPVSLSGSDSSVASFAAPESESVLEFELRVEDSAGNQSTDSVVITVESTEETPWSRFTRWISQIFAGLFGLFSGE